MRAWLVVGVALVVCSSLVLGVSAQAPEQEATPTSESQGEAAPATSVEPVPARTSGSFETTAPVEPSEELVPIPAPPAPKRRVWDVFKVLPILFYMPETSWGFGAGTLFQFRMPGAAVNKRMSSVSLGAVYTLENQTLAQLTPELRFGDDEYVLRADLLGAKYPNRFYGIGNDPSQRVYDTFTDCYARGEVDLRYRPFRRGHLLEPLYVGGHYSAAWSEVHDIKPADPRFESTFAGMNNPGVRPLFASGLGPSLAWDSRDSLNWPNHGSFVEIKATAYEPWLGSDVRYRRLLIDARRYQPLWLDHVLALRLVAQSVWGDVPFQRLPQLGGAGMFRGWYTGQLRGPRLFAIEAEYRVPLSKRWAVVGFGSAGRVGEHVRSLNPKGMHLAGGGGLRFSVDKHDRVNIRLDMAYGDSFRPYLQFREAF
jgi:hypothetical protein